MSRGAIEGVCGAPSGDGGVPVSDPTDIHRMHLLRVEQRRDLLHVRRHRQTEVDRVYGEHWDGDILKGEIDSEQKSIGEGKGRNGDGDGDYEHRTKESAKETQ